MGHESVGIAIFGHGTVGRGVLRLLSDQRDLLLSRTGLSFDVRHLVVRDPARHGGTNPPAHSDVDRAIADPEVRIVVELIGGTQDSHATILRAARAGKHVVTANKSVLAAHGAELFAEARKHNVCVAFEASCGGGIPIIDALTHGLLANRIDALVGIVNGTCNFILTRMGRNGWSYQQALGEAQRLGFAEAEPSLDVSGRDAAQKLALLGSLAFDAQVSEQDLYVEGIERIQPLDLSFADELGYVIKLLAIAHRTEGNKLVLRVHPTLVHKDDVLAEVSDSFNAISVYGHAVGHALFYGRGAGQMPTASAVVADLISVALGVAPLTFSRLRNLPDRTPRANVLPIDQLYSRYYLRVTGRDLPGTMAQITSCLGRHGISISAVLQREDNGGNLVPVVVTTHMAREGAMQMALQEIDKLDVVQAPTVRIRIIDQPREYPSAP